MKSVSQILLNPIRMRIIQEVAAVKGITTTELCKKISDVPRTTMYRHIKILINNNFLAIVSEQRVRGSLERTLALNTSEFSKHNNIENASQNAYDFLMCNYAKFHNYFRGEKPDPHKDKLFLNSTTMMMNDEEFDKFLGELKELIIKYNYKPSEGRKMRDISIISAPFNQEKKILK